MLPLCEHSHGSENLATRLNPIKLETLICYYHFSKLLDCILDFPQVSDVELHLGVDPLELDHRHALQNCFWPNYLNLIDSSLHSWLLLDLDGILHIHQ